MRFVIALLVTIVMALPAASRPLNVSEQTTLDSALASFIRAIQTKRMRQVVNIISPKVMAAIAKSMHTTPQKMRRELIREMRTELKDIRYSDMVVKTAGLDARDAITSDGAAITYTFVPKIGRAHV